MAFDTVALLDWYERVKRPLQWRATRDPYALLVSEVMLQQTQAARVVPYYEAFLARFPDVASLATASARDAHTRGNAIAAWKRTSGRRSVSARRRRSVARGSPISPSAVIAICRTRSASSSSATSNAGRTPSRSRSSTRPTCRCALRSCSRN